MLKRDQSNQITEILVAAARAEIIPRRDGLENLNVQVKSGDGVLRIANDNPMMERADEVVTEADIAAEKFITSHLSEMFPDDHIVGEETIGVEGIAALKPLLEEGRRVWISDPLDGTRNFIQGNDQFATILTCVFNGKVVCGWIYHIMTGDILFAERGRGVFWNGEKLKKPDFNESQKIYLHADIQAAMQAKNMPMPSWAAPTISSSAMEGIKTALGQIAGFVTDTDRIWDHGVNLLIAEELGFVFQRVGGGSYHATDIAREHFFEGKQGVIMASNMEMAGKIHRFLTNLGICPRPY